MATTTGLCRYRVRVPPLPSIRVSALSSLLTHKIAYQYRFSLLKMRNISVRYKVV